MKLVLDKESEEPEGWIVKEKASGKCAHLEVIVDAELRRAECGVCGESLDPIQCLINMARREQKIVSRIEELRRLDAYQKEREKSCRENRSRKERKQLIAAFGERAMTDFLSYGGQRLYDGKWLDLFTHTSTKTTFGIERRYPKLWARAGSGWEKIEVQELSKSLQNAESSDQDMPPA